MRQLIATIVLAAITISASAQVDDIAADDVYDYTTRQIFIYSPNPQGGLHIARRDSTLWTDMGRLCSSDYGTWGAEKRMYKPSVARMTDGTWRAVWQVNDYSPTFAAAYSRDLISWRPQDFPRMSTSQCLEPVVLEADNSADIYYKSREGRRYVSASADFRHFTADEPTNVDDAVWIVDTATVDGHLYEGNIFYVTPEELLAVARHMDAQAEDYQKSLERMHDDAVRLANLTDPVKATLSVDITQRKAISDKLIGVFFEDISYAADGGLYAEMVQNRDFEYTAKDHSGWNAAMAWSMTGGLRIDTVQALSAANPHYVLLRADTLYNEGWDGMAVEAGKSYDFTMFVRLCDVDKKQFTVSIINPEGKVIASAKVKTQGNAWTQYSATLTAKQTEANARLALVAMKEGEAAIDMISLFPQETFMNRKNGLRKDLAQAIADMKPKFVRFPGGCMSHGQGLGNIYHWNETVGLLQDRKPDFNIWHYHQTRGLGFFEFFQFCEDIGAEPLPVLAAGVPCQNSANDASGYGGQQGGIPMQQMPAYIQELLDMIDWANGDPATSKWAKMRADAGHPEPFNLKYIGIGNEDIISTVFEERYEMICKAIREKYPDIKICGTVGPFHSPSSDYIEGWEFTRRNPDLQYMVDEHYYESTGWFLHHRDYYDNYPRTLSTTPGSSLPSPKVYLGEYAASTKAKRPNVETALSEAIYLTDIERNGDIVEMTSYAPLLCKDGHSNWNPDMIYFSNTAVRTTPAYDVQRLFSIGGGNEYLTSRLTIDQSFSNLQHRIAASVVNNTSTGRCYLKLVNALPVELQLSLQGIAIPEGTEAEGFQGKPEDQRTDCQRTAIPSGSHVTLPPYSFRLVDISDAR